MKIILELDLTYVTTQKNILNILLKFIFCVVSDNFQQPLKIIGNSYVSKTHILLNSYLLSIVNLQK